MFDLKNKVIVITGATGVLASSLALSLAKNKARLVLLGRNQKLLDELTKKIKSILRKMLMTIWSTRLRSLRSILTQVPLLKWNK